MPRCDEQLERNFVRACVLLIPPLVACTHADNAMEQMVATAMPASEASGAGGDLSPASQAAPASASAAASGKIDSGVAESGGAIAQAVCSGDLPVMSGYDAQSGVVTEPDWGCYADATSAVDDADAGIGPQAAMTEPAISRVTYAPGNNVGFSGATLDQFFGPSTLGKPASSGVTDSNGQVNFQAPRGTQRISLWLHAMKDSTSALSDFVDSYVLDLPMTWPPGVNSASAFISVGVDTTFVNVLGSAELGDKTKALVGAVVRDCQGHDVGGAQIELIDMSTNTAVALGTGAGEPRAVYGRFALPDKTCTFTTSQRAEWLMLNAPVNVSQGAVSQRYKIRSKGRQHASDIEPVTLAEQAVELHSGGYTFTYPYRTWPITAP